LKKIREKEIKKIKRSFSVEDMLMITMEVVLHDHDFNLLGLPPPKVFSRSFCGVMITEADLVTDVSHGSFLV
jgi:hypothetical protein